MSILVETFGTAKEDPAKIEAVVRAIFDLRPGAIVRDLDLKRPIYKASAAYGHFGRDQFPWEQLGRLDEFKAALGA
jgi:S-adenosylmethionine synthetase